MNDMEDVLCVLDDARKKGVDLWLEEGELRYRAPKGRLTREEIERLRKYKGQIASLLNTMTASAPALSEQKIRGRFDRAPLAFSQLAHWRLHCLARRRVVRGVSSATTLRGPLSIEALKKALAETVRHHDALRTAIVVCDGVPYQEVRPSCDDELTVRDLTSLSESLRHTEATRLIDEYLAEKIDVTIEPLFKVWLLRIRDEEHILVLAMEHIISDGVSGNILLRDIFLVYVQVLEGKNLALAEVPIQFTDYAARQREAHAAWIASHEPYWSERLKGARRLRVPSGRAPRSVEEPGWGLLPIRIDSGLTSELRRCCKEKRTTLVMCVFAAYVAFFLRRCNAEEAVFLFHTDGRFIPATQAAIGYFAFRLYLRLRLPVHGTFDDLIGQVTKEYCNAHEHADYWWMESQEVPPEFTQNSCFNWVIRDFDSFSVESPEGTIVCSDFPFEQRTLPDLQVDAEPIVGLYECGDEIHGLLQFSFKSLSFESSERLAGGFLSFIKALLRLPESDLRHIPLMNQ